MTSVEMLKLIITKRVNITEFMMVQSYKDWMLNYGKFKDSRFRLTKEEFEAIMQKVRVK